jgi:hypothetical protein
LRKKRIEGVCVRGGEGKLEERKKKSVNPKQTTRG